MRKKILAFVFAAALLVGTAVPMFGGGGTASAVPPNFNGHNCRGLLVSLVASNFDGVGDITSWLAQHGLQDDVATLLANCGDNGS